MNAALTIGVALEEDARAAKEAEADDATPPPPPLLEPLSAPTEPAEEAEETGAVGGGLMAEWDEDDSTAGLEDALLAGEGEAAEEAAEKARAGELDSGAAGGGTEEEEEDDEVWPAAGLERHSRASSRADSSSLDRPNESDGRCAMTGKEALKERI